MYRRGDVSQVARAFRILNALRGFRRGRTLSVLAREANVSVRTIRRDVADLVDAGLRIDLLPVDGQPGARLIDRGYASVTITTRERFTLLAVRSVFDVLRGTPLHEDVLSVLEKLEQREGGDAPAFGTTPIAYVPDGGTKAYEDKTDIIDALQDGILRHRVVEFAYRNAGGRRQQGLLAPASALRDAPVPPRPVRRRRAAQ